MSQTAPALPGVLVPSFDAPASSPLLWLREMAEAIRGQMLVHGAVLVHGLRVSGTESLAEVRDALDIASHTPTEVFNSRQNFGNGILSPISWPHDRPICPFQESSFSKTFPSTVLTACITPPDGGGQAHLSDARRIAEHLPAQLADRIRKDGWIMTRAFHDGFGISWRDAFSVADHAELDMVLEAEGIKSEWLPDGALHTVRHQRAFIDHPTTGEECWFNQISFLNAGSLDPTERRVLARSFGEHLPMNTYFGDGSPLSDEDLTAIYYAYALAKTDAPWHRGDLLIADNIIMAQGRSAYAGSCEFLIALGGD